MKSALFNYKIHALLALFITTLLSQVSFATSPTSSPEVMAHFQSLSPNEAYASKDYDQITQKVFVPAFEASIAPRRLCVYDGYIFGTEMRDHCSQYAAVAQESDREQLRCVQRKYDFPVAPLGDLSPYYEVTFVKNSLEVGKHFYPLQNCSDVVSSKRASSSAKSSAVLIESSGEYSGGSVIKKKPRQ